MSRNPVIFDYQRRKAKVERARRINKPDADFLVKLAAQELADRISIVNRSFDHAVDIDGWNSSVTEIIGSCRNVSGIEALALSNNKNQEISAEGNTELCEVLGLATRSQDLIVSCFGLHWVNDLPGMLAQIEKALMPDGLFAAVLPADGTLFEMKDCLIEAETELTGGASMRVDPFLEIRQVGDLLQRAKFALPVTDLEEFIVRYGSLNSLIADLRAMGVTSALTANSQTMPRGLIARAQEIYCEKYSDEDGRLRATFRFIFLSGWAVHESQQKPLARGSAQMSLETALKDLKGK